MSLQTQAEIGLLLILAAALSAAIGLDREERAPAGLRTHMLVGIGACLLTVLSIHAFPGGDPARDPGLRRRRHRTEPAEASPRDTLADRPRQPPPCTAPARPTR